MHVAKGVVNTRRARRGHTYEGNGAFWCKPSSWYGSGGQMNVFVNCFDTTGALRNVRFSALTAWAAPVATLLPFN